MRAYEFIFEEAPPRQNIALMVGEVPPATATTQQRLQTDRQQDQAATQRDKDFISQNNAADKENAIAKNLQSRENFATDQQQDAIATSNRNQINRAKFDQAKAELGQAYSTTQQQDQAEAQARQQTQADRLAVGKQIAVTNSLIPKVPATDASTQPKVPGSK